MTDQPPVDEGAIEGLIRNISATLSLGHMGEDRALLLEEALPALRSLLAEVAKHRAKEHERTELREEHIRARARYVEARNILHSEVRELRQALEEIAKGGGPYSQDPLKHASNTIESMKQIAKDALNNGP